MIESKETGATHGNSHNPDLSVAEQEALIRAKFSAGQNTATPGSRSGIPEVSRLKSRRQHHSLFLIVGVLAGLVIMAGMADWMYRKFLYTPGASKEAAMADDSGTPVPERSGMGTDLRPFVASQPEPEVTLSEGLTRGGQLTDRAALPSFNKVRALVNDSASPAQARTAVLSRVHERAVNTGQAAPSTAMVPSPEVKGGVTRIAFNPDLYIPENTWIPCTLQTRFVSDVAGRISCNIAEDVYSASGYTLLIEKGTKAKGVYKTGTLKAGQDRMFIVWTELRTPDAKKISLVDTQVVGQLGEAGIEGWIDTHFWQRFGNALMLSTVQDVAAAAAGNAPGKNRNTDYTENTRAATAEMAKMALENSINIPPTLYRNQGDIIGMLVGEDIDFSSIYALKLKQD